MFTEFTESMLVFRGELFTWCDQIGQSNYNLSNINLLLLVYHFEINSFY
jgi:hypothetical protein